MCEEATSFIGRNSVSPVLEFLTGTIRVMPTVVKISLIGNSLTLLNQLSYDVTLLKTWTLGKLSLFLNIT